MTKLAALFLGTTMVMVAACGGTEDPVISESAAQDNITYMDIATHPGCTTVAPINPPRELNSWSSSVATIANFNCNAKEYPLTVAEKTDKPIVLLIHGNSDTPNAWQKCETGVRSSACVGAEDMLAEKLAAAGIKTYAMDLRFDKVDAVDNVTMNPARNMDHGWAVPLAQSLIKAVLEANPGRKVAIVGHSLGSTVVRDALRRLQVNEKKFDLWKRMSDVVLASGANHGVSTYSLCAQYGNTMRGRVACEMGNREAFTVTDFLTPLNGEGAEWETPCADGKTAYGQEVCSGAITKTYTITVKDPADKLKDEFVSQTSVQLKGATNYAIAEEARDASGYFYGGYFKYHYGAVRSVEGRDTILGWLTD